MTQPTPNPIPTIVAMSPPLRPVSATGGSPVPLSEPPCILSYALVGASVGLLSVGTKVCDGIVDGELVRKNDGCTEAVGVTETGAVDGSVENIGE